MDPFESLRALAAASGWDPYPIVVDPLPTAVLANYTANLLPNRFAHWIFGRPGEDAQGASLPVAKTVYHNPMHLFLLLGAPALQQKIAYAEAIGHADFFRHNRWMRLEPIDPLLTFRQHAAQIRDWEEACGQRRVATLIRHAWSIQDFPDLVTTICRESPELAHWERTVLSILAEEWSYLEPFARTRLVNAGWATVCRKDLLRKTRLLSHEAIDWARWEAVTMNRRTPASIGYHLLMAVIEREGRAGAERVRTTHQDTELVEHFLSDDLARRLYSAKAGEEDAMRRKILHALANLGRPELEIAVQADTLHLTHRFDGRELDVAELKMVLQSIQALWRRPVIFTTVVDDQRVSMRYERQKLVETRYH